ncbi:hypothetical protein [Roseateles sp.]|uniref:hypothetical protein n=1 Tax=Roseateles sp. TaxID=1971397 RepID=UPI003263F904
MAVPQTESQHWQFELLGVCAAHESSSTQVAVGPGDRPEGRDRLTVDLRGLGSRLRARALQSQTTPAALVRSAVVRMLGEEAPSDEVAAGQQRPVTAGPAVKVTLRLPPAQAALLAARARAADVAQGNYVAALLDGIPPAPLPSDYAAAVQALIVSTDRLAAISVDLNAFLRLLGHVPSAELERYRAGLRDLVDDVRKHLASAATLIAELRPARRPRP